VAGRLQVESHPLNSLKPKFGAAGECCNRSRTYRTHHIDQLVNKALGPYWLPIDQTVFSRRCKHPAKKALHAHFHKPNCSDSLMNSALGKAEVARHSRPFTVIWPNLSCDSKELWRLLLSLVFAVNLAISSPNQVPCLRRGTFPSCEKILEASPLFHHNQQRAGFGS